MRPFSREVDEKEHHREPTEFIETMWEVLKMTGGASTSPVMGAKQEGDKRRRTGNVTSVVYVEKLAWGDCGMYLSTPMPLLGGAAVGAAGTPEQKKKFLARFAEGKPKWAAMAITEPGAGSDAGAIQTTATLDGDHWVLNGEKIFVTAGKRAVADSEGFVVVWASIDKKAGRAGIKSFVVDHHTPGMTVAKVEHKHGIRCSDTAVIVFDNCRIPKENLLGDAEIKAASTEGFKGAMATFDATRPPVAASAVGVGRAALETAEEKLAASGFKPRYGVAPSKLTARERDLMMMQAKVRASWLLTLQGRVDVGHGRAEQPRSQHLQVQGGPRHGLGLPEGGRDVRARGLLAQRAVREVDARRQDRRHLRGHAADPEAGRGAPHLRLRPRRAQLRRSAQPLLQVEHLARLVFASGQRQRDRVVAVGRRNFGSSSSARRNSAIERALSPFQP